MKKRILITAAALVALSAPAMAEKMEQRGGNGGQNKISTSQKAKQGEKKFPKTHSETHGFYTPERAELREDMRRLMSGDTFDEALAKEIIEKSKLTDEERLEMLRTQFEARKERRLERMKANAEGRAERLEQRAEREKARQEGRLPEKNSRKGERGDKNSAKGNKGDRANSPKGERGPKEGNKPGRGQNNS